MSSEKGSAFVCVFVEHQLAVDGQVVTPDWIRDKAEKFIKYNEM